MKITVKRDSPAFIVLVNSIGADHHIIDNMTSYELDKDGNFTFDLELKMNGQQLDFNNFIKSINNAYDKAVDEGVKRYINKQLLSIGNALEEIRDRTEDLVKTLPYSWGKDKED